MPRRAARRLVPICFVLDDEDGRADLPVLCSAIDDKPKESLDPHKLGRVRDLVGAPQASVLVASWDEDCRASGGCGSTVAARS